MADSDRTFVLEFKTTEDGSGASAAKQAIDGVKGAAEGASESTGRLGIESGRLLHDVEVAADGSARGLLGAGVAAGKLASALGMAEMGPVFGVMAALVLAVEAVSKALDDSTDKTEALKTQNEDLLKAIDAWRTKHFDDIGTEYKKVRGEIETTQKAAEELRGAYEKLAESRMREQLAQLQLQEQDALAKLDPKDKDGRERVKKDYSDQRSQVEAQGAADKAISEKNDAAIKAQQALDAASAAQKHLDDERAKFAHEKEALQADKQTLADKQAQIAGLEQQRKDARSEISQEDGIVQLIQYLVTSRRVKREEAPIQSQVTDLDKEIQRKQEELAKLEKEIEAANVANITAQGHAQAAPVTVAAADADAQAAAAKMLSTQKKSVNDSTDQAQHEADERAKALKKAEREALERQLHDLEAQRQAKEAQQRQAKEKLTQEKEHKAPEDFEIARQAATHAIPNAQKAMQDLIVNQTAALNTMEHALLHLNSQIASLKAKMESTISNQ